jgi:hypothetical protein
MVSPCDPHGNEGGTRQTIWVCPQKVILSPSRLRLLPLHVNGVFMLGVACADRGAETWTISIFRRRAILPISPARFMPFVGSASGQSLTLESERGFLLSH